MRMPTLPHAAPLAGLALRCQPDSRLVGLSREGRTRAFEEIVRRYREPLVSFAGAIVPPHRAEDVVQEALAKAHAALAASDAEIKLKPWLYTIVRNRALNDLRDEPTHEHLDESFDGVPQPPEVAARREQLAALIAQVKDLPPAQRDALVQRELEGRSHREIGVAMGVTPGAVRGLIFRARTALRDVAGMLVPMPALRALLNAGPLQAEAAGTGIGGVAVGLSAGGGIAIKAGTTLAIAVLAIGSGIALNDRGSEEGASPGSAAHAGPGRADHGAASHLYAADRSSAFERTTGGSGLGGEGSRSDSDSGHSSGAPRSSGDDAIEEGGGSGESEGGDSGDDRHSGSGTGGSEEESSSGTGGGEEEGSGGSGTDEDSGSISDGDGTSGDGGTSGESGAETIAAHD
jgi:RNA polymerase sigma factor (sigma-70 family)